ncbi:hypothetical protein EON64_18435 [archaeon]|nr:MAG: hypothetical protein EON64_18435 [archaeon]
MADVYCKDRDVHRPLYLGGVKANVGHLEPAAGMAGLLALLCVGCCAVAPPNANLFTLNPRISSLVRSQSVVFPQDPIKILSDKALEIRSIFAGVSSFGYSGTISHVVLEIPVSRMVLDIKVVKKIKPLSTAMPLYTLLPHRAMQDPITGSNAFVTYLHKGLLSSWGLDCSSTVSAYGLAVV